MSVKNQFVSQTIEAMRKSSGMSGSESVVYVALGDSVTAGWMEHGILDSQAAYPNLLRHRLNSLFPHAMLSVINAGLGGDSTDTTLARLERDCLRYAPNLVTVCLGLNDVRKGLEFLESYKANLAEIVRRLQIESKADILLITPNTRGDALQTDGVVAEFVRVIRATAREKGVGLADVNAIYQGAIRTGVAPADLLSNRISHPTREGHQIYANALMEFFQP